MPDFIVPILKHHAAGDTNLVWLLDACVGRLARRDPGTFEIQDRHLSHIVDWLRAALVNDEPWLKNVDAHGRPKKLMKFGSVDAIVREADKAMLKAAQRLKGVKLVEGDEEFVEMLEDGYYVVRLLTPAALDRESAEMQHCIGNGGYDKYLGDSKYGYYSLRDPAGHPHVTMELISNHLFQFQGKQNNFPSSRYCSILLPFFKSQKWLVDLPAYELGHIQDTNGDWHPIDCLPDGLEVRGNLDLGRLPDYPLNTPVITLPKGLKVGGTLDLRNSGITVLKDGLQVLGSLDISDTEIRRLPDNLSVGGFLDASRSKIRRLPTGLKIGGPLIILQTMIDELPADLCVGGDFHLNETEVTVFPKGITVGGSIWMSNSKIRSLPDGLHVRISLHLEKSDILELPEGLRVGGALHLTESKVTKLPKDFEVKGSLHLAHTRIDQLPSDLKVWGNLSLLGTDVSNLPEGLVVADSLDLRGTRISVLPDDIKVGRRLNICGTSIKFLPPGIRDDVIVKCDFPIQTAGEFRDLDFGVLEIQPSMPHC